MCTKPLHDNVTPILTAAEREGTSPRTPLPEQTYQPLSLAEDQHNELLSTS